MTIATLKIVFWALAFVFFVVCEVATGTALVSIWLAIAALIAMFCAIAKLSFLTQCKGRVTLEGTDWAARTEDGSKISEGTPVKVVRIDGAKLIVSEEK